MPVPDELTAEFWAATRERVLKIRRCCGCGVYQHPPAVICMSCHEYEFEYVPVSGRGTVESFTSNQAGARHPAFVERTPYLVGLVELVEQSRLLMYTNFPGATMETLQIGAPVEVGFEQLSDDIWLPQFSLVNSDSEATHE